MKLAMRLGPLVLGAALTQPAVASPPLPPGNGGPAVVVELFSSEGCSSCPPADAYLRELDRTQPVKGVTVIALEEHVDYWNDLGWTDPFSQAQFSDRQREYATAFGDHRIYTPELLVDGHTPTDRSHAEQDLLAAAREPKARIELERKGASLGVTVRGVPADANDPAEIWLALTESDLSTHVERGENGGRTLAHAPVVRRLVKIGRVDEGKDASTASGDGIAAANKSLRAVVFVQRAKSRRILGATQMPL